MLSRMAGCERDASRLGTVATVLAVAASGLLPACGSGGEAPKHESAALCGGDRWQPVVTLPAGDGTATLAYQNGLLYYSTTETPALIAMPADGSGSATTLAPVAAQQLWVEGSQILFTQVSNERQVFSVPATGGTPQMVLDTSAGRTDSGYPIVHGLSGIDYYWIEYTEKAPHPVVWRASLVGGAPEQIATLKTPPGASIADDVLPEPIAQQMTLGEDSLLVWGDFVFEIVPFAPGPVRVLVPSDAIASGEVIGLDGGGAYWRVPFGDPMKSTDQWSVVQEPADGSTARTLLQTTGHQTMVTAMWPTGEDGWVAIVQGVFDDGQSHTAVSLLAADGTSRTLGCSPASGLNVPDIHFAPAIAPDAIYVIATGNGGGPTQLVRIPR